ncbi:MAG: hypothetical protein GDA56_00495 [Hormoscilla sp. GM7CHS1pb]|nr:hypothetical protein [Hormoscilla sp. GM7CHS1pb]
MSTNPFSQWTKKIAISLGSASLCFGLLNLDAKAEAASLLWWDSSVWHGGQLADPFRQEMPDFLNEFDGGDLFNTTYISSKTPGEFATHLASNSYDVIVLDSGNNETIVFNEDDRVALQAHYSNNSNLMLDGSLLIRSFNYAPATDFPGPNGALGGFLANQVYQLAERGGGIMIGSDHYSYQRDGNQMLSAIVPGAAFSGITNPSSDGVFYGTDLLNSVASVAPADVFTHWSSVPSQGISPTGEFTDFLGDPITLYSQVDVANKPGGGPKYSYISTSWEPGSEITSVTGVVKNSWYGEILAGCRAKHSERTSVKLCHN